MAHADLSGRRVLAVVTNYGIEQDELIVPVTHLRDDGATVDVAAAEQDTIQTLIDDKDPGEQLEPSTTIAAVDAGDYDLLLLPGGAINADKLRVDADAVALVKAFAAAGKPIAAICHAPWTLIEADVVQGRRMTSFPSLRTDLRNAGADWVDEAPVVDDTAGFTLITARDPHDIDAFVSAIDDVLAPVPA